MKRSVRPPSARSTLCTVKAGHCCSVHLRGRNWSSGIELEQRRSPASRRPGHARTPASSSIGSHSPCWRSHIVVGAPRLASMGSWVASSLRKWPPSACTRLTRGTARCVGGVLKTAPFISSPPSEPSQQNLHTPHQSIEPRFEASVRGQCGKTDVLVSHSLSLQSDTIHGRLVSRIPPLRRHAPGRHIDRFDQGMSSSEGRVRKSSKKQRRGGVLPLVRGLGVLAATEAFERF